MPAQIKYQKGYKYRLFKQVIVKVPILLEDPAVTSFIKMSTDGILTIKKGYSWDGCSGPTWDDKTNLRAGLIHDALYQLMRLGMIPQKNKDAADRELQRIMVEDGAFKIRAWYFYQAVKTFGGRACSLGYDPYQVLTAP